ncbi:hypothetical protein HELRODRAFT_179311 [Helobdella robusta]|uniref:WW domain-containing protein n=1 Tax=Helobdella robusta TaxID=6412 RepID=T1FEJ1_HELRO|nr:hypothetical protein HELRODRAFT_179311 [Helobdella robusta]ESN95536.1 hypothetical protein HELRODRAFT_179311 [Helobdella robusta]
MADTTRTRSEFFNSAVQLPMLTPSLTGSNAGDGLKVGNTTTDQCVNTLTLEKLTLLPKEWEMMFSERDNKYYFTNVHLKYSTLEDPRLKLAKQLFDTNLKLTEPEEQADCLLATLFPNVSRELIRCMFIACYFNSKETATWLLKMGYKGLVQHTEKSLTSDKVACEASVLNSAKCSPEFVSSQKFSLSCKNSLLIQMSPTKTFTYSSSSPLRTYGIQKLFQSVPSSIQDCQPQSSSFK